MKKLIFNLLTVAGLFLYLFFAVATSQDVNTLPSFDMIAEVSIDESNRTISITNKNDFDYVSGQLHLFHVNDTPEPAFLEYFRKNYELASQATNEVSFSEFSIDGTAFPDDKSPTSLIIFVRNDIGELGTMEVEF